MAIFDVQKFVFFLVVVFSFLIIYLYFMFVFIRENLYWVFVFFILFAYFFVSLESHKRKVYAERIKINQTEKFYWSLF